MTRYRIGLIRDARNNLSVAIAYCQNYPHVAQTTVRLSNNDATMFGEISQNNTCVLLNGISTDAAYQMDIMAPDRVISGIIEICDDGSIAFAGVDNDANAMVEVQNTAAMMRATYIFQTYTSSGALSGSYASLFRAVDKARQLGSNAYVMLNGAEVFRYGISGRYYRYQFTANYGYVTSTSAADAWVNGYNCACVIQSNNAKIYAATINALKGSVSSWMKEPNHGAYYYQYSLNSTDKSASATVKLSQAKLKPSQNVDQWFVPYVYINVHNSTSTYDLGICYNDYFGAWTLASNPAIDHSDTSKRPVCSGEHEIAHVTENSSGELIADGDIKITVTCTASAVTATVTNTTTGAEGTITFNTTAFASGNHAFLLAVSYVPAYNGTPDYRCEGYFKNVKLTNCSVVTAGGTSNQFYSSSTRTSTAFAYNTDCCTVTAAASSTTVDIAYDKAYRT